MSDRRAAAPTWRLSVLVVVYLTVAATVTPFLALSGGSAAAAGNDGCVTLQEAADDAVTDGVTISESGCYVVTQNYTGNGSGSFVSVTADDVVLRGEGNTLLAGETVDDTPSEPVPSETATPPDSTATPPDSTATPPDSTEPVGPVAVTVADATNVSVTELTVESYDTGLRVRNVTDLEVAGVVARDTERLGITLDRVTGGVVADTVVTDTLERGVRLRETTQVTLRNVSVDGGGPAVSARGTDGVEIRNSSLDRTPPSTTETLVYVDGSDGRLKSLTPDTAMVTDYGVQATVVGPPARLDGDRVPEVPYVAGGALRLVAADGEPTVLVPDDTDAEPLEGKSKLAIDDRDRWREPGVLYASANGSLYRATVGERPTRIGTSKQVQFVVGVFDADGDERRDPVYVSASSGLRYVDSETGEDLKIPVAETWGANNQIGFGEPAAVDGEFVAPRVSGSGTPQLQRFDGSVETLSNEPVVKTAPTAVDLDRDGDSSVLYVAVNDTTGETELVATRAGESLQPVEAANTTITPDPAVGLASRVTRGAATLVTTDTGGVVGSDVTVDGVTGVSFTVDNASVAGQQTVPNATDATALGGGVVVENTTAAATKVTFGYSDAAVDDETTVAVGRYDATTESWTFVNSSRNESADTVTATPTPASGLFAPFAGATPADTSPSDTTPPDVTVDVVDRLGAASEVVVESNESLATLEVEVDTPGPEPPATRNRTAFTATQSNSSFRYTLPLTTPAGTVTVDLLTATDAAGNAAGEQNTTGTVSSPPVVDADADAGYREIQPAVDNATEGETVHVRAGDYTAVTLDKNVTLQLADGARLDGAVGVEIVGDAAPTVEGGEFDGSQTAVDAGGTSGDWTLRSLTVSVGETGVGVNATNASGAWLVANTTVGGVGETGLVADGTTGDWVVRDSTFLDRRTAVRAAATSGDWTVRNTTVQDASVSGVRASTATGDWAVRGVTVETAGESGVDAAATTGDWTVANTTVTAAKQASVDAANTTGDWVVTNLTATGDGTVQNGTREAVAAFNATGDWTVRGVTTERVAGGVDASLTSGDWTVRDSFLSVDRFAVTATRSTGDWQLLNTTTGGPGAGNATVGVVAEAATGDWLIDGSRLVAFGGGSGTGSGTAVYAPRTEGAWTVTESTLVGAPDRPTVNATGGAVVGDATGVWWGQPRAQATDCVGSVDCGERRSGSPFVDVTLTTNNTVVVGESLAATATVTNDWRVPATLAVQTGVGGEPVEQLLQLTPGESRTVNVSLPTPQTAGPAAVVSRVVDTGAAPTDPGSSTPNTTALPAVARATATVDVRAAFALAVQNVSAETTAAGATVTSAVTNTGVRAGTGAVNVSLDTDSDGQPDGEITNRTVDIAAGETTLVTFELNRSTAGAADSFVVAGGWSPADGPGGVTTTAVAVPDPPALNLTGVTVPPAAAPEQTVAVPVRVDNVGDSPGNATVDLTVTDAAGTTVADDQRSVTVPAGGRTTQLSFDADALAAGNYTVTVSVDGPLADGAGAVTRSLTVQPETPALRVTSEATLGAVPLGEERTVQVTLTNDGEVPVRLTEVTTDGPVSLTADAPERLAASTETTVGLRVTAPTTAGSFEGQLRVESTDPDEPVQTVTVTGEARGPIASPNRERVRFFSQPVGETATATLLLDNPGNEPLTVESVEIDGADGFTLRGERGLDAGGTVAAGDTGELRFAFTPAAGGSRTATVRVETDGGSFTTRLTGAGEQPRAAVDRDRIGFGAVGTESTRTQTVQLRNDGGAPLAVANVTLAGADADAFEIVAGGGSGTLVPGERRAVRVRFGPETAGTQTARLNVTASGPTAPSVALSGVGNVSEVNLTTADPTTPQVAVGSVGVGSSGLAEVTLTNDGNETLLVRNATVTGVDADEFRAVTADGVSVAPGESTTLGVAFSPAAVGDSEATLSLATNDPDEPVVDLTVTGQGATASVSATPAAVAFGAVRTETSERRTITVENTGSAPATLARATFATGSAFTVTDGLDATTLQPDEQTTVRVQFAPTSRGEATDLLRVENDTGAVVTRVSVGGVGTAPVPQLDTTRLSFADTRVAGETTGTVRVTNDGNAPLNLSTVAVADGPFVVRDRPQTLRAGGSARIEVAFQPTATGPESGRLRVGTNASAGLPQVRLSGTAVTVDAAADGNATFGEVAVGETVTRNVTIRNRADASASLNVTGAAVVGPDRGAFTVTGETAFGEALTNGSTDAPVLELGAGAERNVTVALSPESTGQKFGRLRLFTTDPRTPQLDTFLSNTDTVIEVDTNTDTATGDANATISVQNPPENATLPANVSNPETLRENVGVENLNVSVDDPGNFSVELSQADQPPSNAPNFSAPDDRNVAPVKYVRVNETLADGDVRNATFQLRVSKVQVNESGTSPEEISLYRFVDDEWVELNGTLVDETTTHYVYRVATPGFSDFAAGAKKPEFEITEANIPPADVSAVAIRVGDEVDILVRITNEEGAADGTFTTRLLLDGEEVDRRDVTVAAGGTRQIRFVRQFGGAGEFEVVVNNVSAGTVEVSAESSGGGVGRGGGDDESASLSVTNTTLGTEQVEAGESVTVGVRVANPSDDAETFAAPLTVAGVTVADRSVSIPAGGTTTVNYTRSFDRPGTYDVSVGEAFVGTVTVVERTTETPTPETPTERPNETVTPAETATPGATATPNGTATGGTETTRPPTETQSPTAAGEPNVTVAQALVESETVAPGTLVTVTAVVENTGSAAGTRTVPLVVNGVTVSETTVALTPGESRRLTFERRFQTPGTVTVAVGGAAAGQLTVGTETPTASPTTTDTSFPGFGPLVAALAVLVAGLLARRRG